MKRIRIATLLPLVAVLAAPAALASDLSLSVQSAGDNLVIVAPGQSVDYQVVGELSDARNEGLALFSFDLSFSGGALAQAQEPASGPITEFVSPRGVTNPAGFGGTPVGGDLLQVGGAQNTIQNVFAPMPIGDVVTGVGAPGSPAVLAEGTLTAPMTPGTYLLVASDVVANVIRQGQDGSGAFWVVDAAGVGTLVPLTVEVLDCEPSTYCVGKQSSQGCVPQIGSSGTPSLSGPDDFVVTCGDVVNQQVGLWFFGTQPDSHPFMGGVRCVAFPIVRGPVLSSGGDVSPPNCSGSFNFPVTQQFMAAHSRVFVPGAKVYGQWWFRDPLHPDGTGVGLSNALELVVCP